jgi:undecaprenyl-diphosphatase
VVFAALIAIGWALGRLAVATVNATDLHLVRDVAAHRSAALTWLAHALSLLGSGFVLFPVAAVVTVGLVALRRLLGAVTVVLGTAGGVLLSNLDKLLVERPRPPVHHLEHVVTWSFPSGHATQTSAFCVAAVLAAGPVLRRRGVRAGAVAVAVAFVVAVAASRVYLAVHYPSDVVAGALIGTTWSAGAARVLLRRSG